MWQQPTTDASHHGSRGDTECAEISASTNIHSAMELVLRVTVLVENIGVSEMIQLISTLIAVIAASGRAPTLTIITDRAVTDVSTGEMHKKNIKNFMSFFLEISLRTSMNVTERALAPVYFAHLRLLPVDQVNLRLLLVDQFKLSLLLVDQVNISLLPVDQVNLRLLL